MEKLKSNIKSEIDNIVNVVKYKSQIFALLDDSLTIREFTIKDDNSIEDNDYPIEIPEKIKRWILIKAFEGYLYFSNYYALKIVSTNSNNYGKIIYKSKFLTQVSSSQLEYTPLLI